MGLIPSLLRCLLKWRLHESFSATIQNGKAHLPLGTPHALLYFPHDIFPTYQIIICNIAIMPHLRMQGP